MGGNCFINGIIEQLDKFNKSGLITENVINIVYIMNIKKLKTIKDLILRSIDKYKT